MRTKVKNEAMNLGIKTKHAKWIYNSLTDEIQCLGALECYSEKDTIPEECFWRLTNGRYISELGNRKEYYWFSDELEIVKKEINKFLESIKSNESEKGDGK